MTLAYKALGQSAPGAASLTTLYTVPSSPSTQAIASAIAIANRGAATTVRVAHSPLGAAIANQHYILFDALIDANASQFLNLGMALAPTDVVRVYNTLATVSFTLWGVEIS